MRCTSFTMKDDEAGKVKSFLSGTETISQFAHKATMEKIKRMEIRNNRARKDLYENDIETFLPIVEEILKRLGK